MVTMDPQNDSKMTSKIALGLALGSLGGHVGLFLGGWKTNEKKHEKMETQQSRECDSTGVLCFLQRELKTYNQQPATSNLQDL